MNIREFLQVLTERSQVENCVASSNVNSLFPLLLLVVLEPFKAFMGQELDYNGRKVMSMIDFSSKS